MKTTAVISIDEARAALGQRPGIVLGQRISIRTLEVDIKRDLVATASKVFGSDSIDDDLASGDFASSLDELAINSSQAV